MLFSVTILASNDYESKIIEIKQLLCRIPLQQCTFAPPQKAGQAVSCLRSAKMTAREPLINTKGQTNSAETTEQQLCGYPVRHTHHVTPHHRVTCCVYSTVLLLTNGV